MEYYSSSSVRNDADDGERIKKSSSPSSLLPVLPSAPHPGDQFESVEPNSSTAYFVGVDSTKVQISTAKSPLPWSTSLCNCFDDISSCCLTCCCPCVAFGRIAEIVDRGSTSCGVSGAMYTMMLCMCGCSCMYSCFYRSKLRGQYFLEEGPCTDCCVHCCCEECALCQEYRELKNRGFDMSIGWHGNMERQKCGLPTPPKMQGGMIR